MKQVLFFVFFSLTGWTAQWISIRLDVRDLCRLCINEKRSVVCLTLCFRNLDLLLFSSVCCEFCSVQCCLALCNVLDVWKSVFCKARPGQIEQLFV
jgi:hypothetical protein